MSNKKLSTTKKGFTIIEVVLVLAIAGLIFLMVFVALPALQRNQRDTQRRSDVGRLVTAVTSYRTNTGDMPANMTTANKTIADTNLNGYIDNFNDPGTSTGYLVKIQTLTSSGTGSGETKYMYVYKSAECNGTTARFKDGTGYFAVVSYAETGGTICQDNS